VTQPVTPPATAPGADIHLLLVEDSDDDAVLIVSRLRRGGLDVSYEQVETREAAAAALAARPPDVVISDHHMPAFSAEEALELLRQTGLDVPFILVSGQIGEESAAALMRAGAHDFLLKDRLTRLVPAVQRELREAAGRRHGRQAEAALRDSEQRFRLLAEHAQDIIFRYRLHPTPALEYVSPAVEPILGYRPEELYREPGAVIDAIHPRDRERFAQSWTSAEPEPLVVRWLRPDGRQAWTEQRAVGAHDAEGRLVAVEGILRDVTERVLADQERERLEQQLRQAERLESLGQLAGGVAHDFNNLLGVILGYADLVITTLDPGDQRHADVEGIRQAAERGASLTRQLLIFSRLEPSKPETVDLNLLVADLQRLLRRTIGEDIELASQLAADLPPVTIDRSKMEQVVVNLVVNSRAAMPDGGRITLETGLAAADEDDWPEPRQATGDYVRLTVTDDGTGMPPEVAQRAFEPFFTTKGPGEGTGLGLATAYGAVKDAGGHITLSSEPGAGTRIRVFLPVADDVVTTDTAAPPPAPPPAPRPSGGETVLVVEDEDGVREIARRILTGHGYRVLEAANAADALALLAAPDLHVDALLTDVVMPGLSGDVLVDRVRQGRPGLPALLMSGYTAGFPGGQPLPADVPLIRKPFDAPTLLRRLRDVLDR
jgi:PAS domain S-box-containing protein